MSALGIVFASVEVVAVCVGVARWAYYLSAGAYTETVNVGLDEDAAAFLWHVFLGVFWPLGLSMLIGQGMHRRELRRQQECKRIEREARDLDKLLEERR